MSTDRYTELGRLFADVLEQGLRVYAGNRPGAGRRQRASPRAAAEPVVITGAALGLPGVEQVFDDENLQRILDGQQFIDTIPHRFRQQMVDMHITRLVKREAGDPTFETIDDEADVDQAGRPARAARRGRASSASTPPATPRSTRSPGWRSAPASTRCATPASRWSCATRPPRSAPSCPSAGGCRTRCATTPA